MKTRHALLLALCIVNLVPLLGQQIGGDIVEHLTQMHCFATQFWQGNVLPRWCFAADGGVGSPALMFYPPLPYLVTSLLYPLHWLGVTVYGIYVAGCTLAVLVTVFACYHWLKRISGERAALMGTAIYLFLPYHSEVMVGRSAYAELWVLAFAPLMAAAVEDMIRGKAEQAWRFVLWTALALLSEPAVVICVLIGLGVRVLAEGMGAWRLALRFTLASLFALFVTSFYWLPIMHYLPFISMTEIHEQARSWPSRFVRIVEDWKAGRARLLIGLAVTVAGFAWLCQALWQNRAALPSVPVRREATVWAFSGALSVFMLFPMSAPVWWLINVFAPIGFPWRMQAVLAMAMAALAAIYVYAPSKRSRAKTKTGDLVACLVLLFCLEMWITSTVAPEAMTRLKRMVAAEAIAMPDYRTRWTSWENATYEAAVYRYEAEDQSPVEIISGAGAIRIRQWRWKGIVLDIDALKARTTVRVYQRYFPLWRVAAQDGAYVQLEPEPETGYMLLTVPQGHHVVRLTLEPWYDSFFGVGARREKALERERAVQPDLVDEIILHHAVAPL